MENQNNTQQEAQIRNTPIWKADEVIEMNGLEFEAIFNFINNSQDALIALQNVVNKALLSGKIKLKYEKLNAAGTDYEPVSPAEEAHYEAQTQEMIQQVKALAEQAVERQKQDELARSQEGLPRIDAIVDQTGKAQETKVIA